MTDQAQDFIVSSVKVLAHDHDEAGGVYRLLLGQEIMRSEAPEEVTGVINVKEVVWADDDLQWFDNHGERLSDDEIALRQRDLVREALDAQSAEGTPTVISPRELPGVGDEL